mmetsp:Transcript_11017/g.29110  ORF Transcript_11017/g.29110 Transcript_11017/m.29110 type:complete len:309 (-) Transcript_11017:391-1317(-)
MTRIARGTATSCATRTRRSSSRVRFRSGLCSTPSKLKRPTTRAKCSRRCAPVPQIWGSVRKRNGKSMASMTVQWGLNAIVLLIKLHTTRTCLRLQECMGRRSKAMPPAIAGSTSLPAKNSSQVLASRACPTTTIVEPAGNMPWTVAPLQRAWKWRAMPRFGRSSNSRQLLGMRATVPGRRSVFDRSAVPSPTWTMSFATAVAARDEIRRDMIFIPQKMVTNNNHCPSMPKRHRRPSARFRSPTRYKILCSPDSDMSSPEQRYACEQRYVLRGISSNFISGDCQQWQLMAVCRSVSFFSLSQDGKFEAK